MSDYDFEWPAYVSVAEQRQRAQEELAGLRKRGREVAPVAIEGRKIHSTGVDDGRPHLPRGDDRDYFATGTRRAAGGRCNRQASEAVARTRVVRRTRSGVYFGALNL
jgi:hypothetical protein